MIVAKINFKTEEEGKKKKITLSLDSKQMLAHMPNFLSTHSVSNIFPIIFRGILLSKRLYNEKVFVILILIRKCFV